MKKPSKIKRPFKLKVNLAKKKTTKKATMAVTKGKKLTAKHKAAISRALKKRK